MIPPPSTAIGRLGALLVAPVRRAASLWRTTRRTAAHLPDVVEAVLVLPRLAEHLERVSLQTATLVEMHQEIARVRGDTAALRSIDETLRRVSGQLDHIDANTAQVEQLAQVLLPLQGAALRVGRAADRWPPRGRRQLP